MIMTTFLRNFQREIFGLFAKLWSDFFVVIVRLWSGLDERIIDRESLRNFLCELGVAGGLC